MKTTTFSSDFYDKTPGKKTLYKGVVYESRLEARWAAFFDNLGWDHDYEPCYFKKWKPDFCIAGAHLVYVEVKPAKEMDKEAISIMEASGCSGEMLFLGSHPVQIKNHLHLGWTNETEAVGCDYSFRPAAFGRWEAGAGRIGFCHTQATFTDRISGGYDGGSWGSLRLSDVEIISLWERAEQTILEIVKNEV